MPHVGCEGAQGILISARGVGYPTLMWIGDWILTSSLCSTCLHSLLSHCLQVHYGSRRSWYVARTRDSEYNIAWPIDEEFQFGDIGIPTLKDFWKTICCNLPPLLEGKQS